MFQVLTSEIVRSKMANRSEFTLTQKEYILALFILNEHTNTGNLAEFMHSTGISNNVPNELLNKWAGSKKQKNENGTYEVVELKNKYTEQFKSDLMAKINGNVKFCLQAFKWVKSVIEENKPNWEEKFSHKAINYLASVNIAIKTYKSFPEYAQLSESEKAELSV